MSNTIKSLRNNENKLAMGFCHNCSSESEQGYKLGRLSEMTLSNILVRYHPLAVALMNFSHPASRNLDSKLYKGTADIFFHLIVLIYAQRRRVLIFLGAPNAQIALLSQSNVTLENRIIRLTKQYIIDDLDNYLEQAAITAKDNQAVIPTKLKRKKNYFPSQSTNFIYIIAPESPYFIPGRKYSTYISILDDNYDYLAPQFYNQGSDGIDVDGVGWLVQNNDSQKENFLYYLRGNLVSSTRSFIKIPYDKFFIDPPANKNAATTSYVINRQNIRNTLMRSEKAGMGILSLMTWSENWDARFTKDGKFSAWEFLNRYGYLAGDGTVPGPEPEYAQWATSVRYSEGDHIYWQSEGHACVMEHSSNIYWSPDLATIC